MNIVFIIKALTNPGGGAERVLVDVANGLAERGHSISIISCDGKSVPTYYPLHDAVEAHRLDIGKVSGNSSLIDFYHRIRLYRRQIAALEPDVAVAFMNSSYIPAGLALIGTGIPLVASEHIGPEHYRRRYVEWLLLQAMPLLAARITVVSQQIMDSFNAWLRRIMVVVHNPVSFSATPRKAGAGNGKRGAKILLTVGRMTEQKNQACLIEAFGLIADRFPEWILRIAGDGPLAEDLAAQISSSGLSGRVQLPGNISDIAAEYENADLFALPSRYESFGLATAEAIMHGLPAVGFAGCPGTNELIRPGENGLLAAGNGDAVALAATLSELMADPEACKRLENAPTQWLEEAYGIRHVLDVWERLLTPYAKEGRHR